MRFIHLSVLLSFLCLPSCAYSKEVEVVPTEETENTFILHVAYSKNADPWIWTQSEGSRQLADAINIMKVTISNDGQVVVFQREDTSELFTVNADGSNFHPLVGQEFLAGEDAMIWNFNFAPNDHDIFFTLVENGGSFLPRYDLYRVNADDLIPVPSLVFEPGLGGIAAFSPDGRWMSLYHKGGLSLASKDGLESRTIFNYPDDYEPATLGPEVAWMQDSSGFAVFHTPDPLNDPERGGLWFVPVTGEPFERYSISGTWGVPSPDGKRLGYSTGTAEPEIHIVEADGTDTLYMSMDGVYFKGWAPDSQHFMIIQETSSPSGYGLSRQVILGKLNEGTEPLTDSGAADPVVWISEDQFLFANQGELRLQKIGEPSLLLDDQAYNLFDYALISP